MDTLTSALNPFNIKYVYGIFGGKKREKLDFILEPLQAMLQLSMLAFCPLGTKLTINDNLLGVQLPGMSQIWSSSEQQNFSILQRAPKNL